MVSKETKSEKKRYDNSINDSHFQKHLTLQTHQQQNRTSN